MTSPNNLFAIRLQTENMHEIARPRYKDLLRALRLRYGTIAVIHSAPYDATYKSCVFMGDILIGVTRRCHEQNNTPIHI